MLKIKFKKYISVFLAIMLVFSALYVGLVTFANQQKTNILLDNKTGRIYEVPYALSVNQVYEPNYSTLKYDTLNNSQNTWKRYGTSSDVNDPELVALTDGKTDAFLQISYLEGGSSANGIAFISANRMAIVYDLGSNYSLSEITIKQNWSQNRTVRNFSVYGSESLDGSVFDNRIGIGGGVQESLSAVLDDSKSVRYLVIVFDHVTTKDSSVMNPAAYDPRLTEIECYGEKVAGPKSLLSGNKTAVLGSITLENALIHDPYGSEYSIDYNTLKYNNFTFANNLTYSYRAFIDMGGSWSVADEQTEALALLTTDGNDEVIRIENTAGGEAPLKTRVAIMYDLGAKYDLTSFRLGIDNSIRQIRNISIYVGNATDASIFNNLVANGGSSDANATSIELELNGANAVQYIAIVFDHVSQFKGVNMYGYTPYITQVECFGEETKVQGPKNIILGNKSASLYNIDLETPLIHEPNNNADFKINYETLKYTNLKLLSATSNSFGTQIKDGNSWTTGDPAEQLDLLTEKDNTNLVKIVDKPGGAYSLSHRVAIMYDLGGNYNLTALKLSLNNSDKQLRNFSVYAGNKADATIFDNCVGVGGSDDKTETTLDVILNAAENVSYLLIVFDHVSNFKGVNQYGYQIYLSQIECIGEEAAIDAPRNILLNNTTGELYKVSLANPLVHDVNTPYVVDYSTFKYGDLSLLSATSNSFGTQMVVDGSFETGNPAEHLDLLTQKDNTRTVKIIDKPGGTYSLSNRAAIMFDLGDNYDLSGLKLTVDNSSRMIHNFSVYAGDKSDATIFDNRIGTGGSSEAADSELFIELTNANAKKYILIVFDHVSNFNGVNQYGYQIYLSRVELFGEKSMVAPPSEEEKPESILLGNKTGALYSIALETPYEHDVSSNSIFAIDYRTLKYTNLTLAKKADSYPFGTLTKGESGWVAGDESTNLALLTSKDNEKVVQIQHGRGGNAPLNNRVGILYDLGGWYNISSVSIGVSNNPSVRNFSVYVGNSVDATIFNNRVGIGGSDDKDKSLIEANLNGANQVRYLFIVFDHVSNYKGVNKYGYVINLTSINCYGDVTTAPSDSGNTGYGTNILLNNTSGRIHQVNWSVPRGIEYVPDYKTLKYTHLFDNNAQYKRFGTDFDSDGTNPNVINDPQLVYLTDGDLDETVRIQYAANAEDGFVEEKRIAILYDLGNWYDLSTVIVKQNVAQGRAIRHYSVYAGAFSDSRLLDNRVGVGGGTYESLVSELSSADSVRYLLIVFDNVTTNDSKLTNIHSYNPRLTQIECYGKENKNPTIPVDEKGSDILEKNDNVKVNMVYINHEFSWNDSFENGSYDYKSSDFNLQAAITDTTWLAWSDGDANTDASWSNGRGKAENFNTRYGLLFDLGEFYNVSEIEIDSAARHWSSGRYIYDFTVYGGAVADGSIMNNLIGHGGSKEQVNAVKLDVDKSIRYLLIVFNKQGVDPGNLNDGDLKGSGGDKLDRTNALKGCTWADSGIYLAEVSLFGKKGTDPTDIVTYTDADSGVKVEIITYNNSVLVDSIKIVRTPITKIQKGTISLDAMYPLGDSYKIEFYDNNGNVITDMTGRQFSVWFPMLYGDEILYGIDSEHTMSVINTKLDVANNSIVYTTSPEKQIFDFILASYTNPDFDNSTSDDVDADKIEEKNEINIWLIVIIASAVVVLAGSALLIVFLVKRKNKII